MSSTHAPARFLLRHPLDEDARVTLRGLLDAVFCDEDVARPGWGRLAPDCAVTISESDALGVWRVMVHRFDGHGIVTSPEWIVDQLGEAAAALGATLTARC